ncbi:MAG: sulfate permease [Verrucomicrobia bacterium]|nr:sulfate permease [Kiritimatiellia bacterium]MCP5487686.1 sulfate permease [Verrucomicrobiota bacterium]
MSNRQLEPKFVTVLREGYSGKFFLKDLMAGIIVGIVALPLSIALAIASGVKPEQGLYTAVIGGFLIALFSGSRVQIGGPTGAFIVLVYTTVQHFGYEGLAVATMMAGLLLVAMGLAGLGGAIKFIPYPVTVGFTSGIAVIIFTGQIKDFLGLSMGTLPAEFLGKLEAYQGAIGSWTPAAALLGVGSFLLLTFWPKISSRVPGSLLVIVLATVIVHYGHLPVETIGSRYGSVPSSLPMPSLPVFHWDLVRQVAPTAFAIAMLAGIESLLSAVVADGMTGRRHRSNMELVAQGIANLASPLFLGIPATGAIARTATNIRNGGITPVSGMVHAVTLLLIMMAVGDWASLIPMPVLAAILMRVAINMGEWHLLLKMFKGPKSDFLVLMSTFGLTVLVDLVVAIEVGLVMAAFLFMKRMSEVTQIGFVTRELEDEADDDLDRDDGAKVPEGVEVFEIQGPFFFGAADRFREEMRHLEKPTKVLILRMRHVPVMDATGLNALEDVLMKCRKADTILLLSGVNPQPLEVMTQSGFLQSIGSNRIFVRFDECLAEASRLV